MNEENPVIQLQVFNDLEFDTKYKQHVAELSERLLETMRAWLTEFQDQPENTWPSPMAVGAATYTALLKMSHDVPGDYADMMLSSCATVLLKNDTKFQLAVASLPDLPN